MCFLYCLIPNFKVLGASFMINRDVEFNTPKIMYSLQYHPILVSEVFFKEETRYLLITVRFWISNT